MIKTADEVITLINDNQYVINRARELPYCGIKNIRYDLCDKLGNVVLSIWGIVGTSSKNNNWALSGVFENNTNLNFTDKDSRVCFAEISSVYVKRQQIKSMSSLTQKTK